MEHSALLVVGLVACSGPAARPPTAPARPPAASTACYAGVSTGMGQRARTIARRTIDPAARQIVEDVSHDDAGAHGAKRFHVVMTVDGDQFTMTEAGGAFSGTGNLVGEPWRWTAWTSTSKIPHTAITVEADDEVTETTLRSTKKIVQDGKLLATTTEELVAFDCADWDKVVAALAVPALDAAGCERACRNFATLRYWQRADAELAARPDADRAAARAQKTSELEAKLAAGAAACAKTCLEANNAVQTACIAGATAAEQLDACNAE